MFDSASYASSTPPPSPVHALRSPLPREPTDTSLGEAASIRSGITELSFSPTGTPLSKFGSELGLPTFREDLACQEFAPNVPLDHPVLNTCPSSASINVVPPILSIASDLQLNNFPNSDDQPLERHSSYFSAVEGESSLSERSDDGVEPAHEVSTSSGSASDLCVPTAEEAHHQILWQECPAPRRPTVRIEVRNNVFPAQGRETMGRESFTYACESLPYDAGLRPHAYVDNHEHTTNGKHQLEALAEDFYVVDEFMEEDHIANKSKRPTIFQKLVEGKKMSKLMTLGPLKFQKPPGRFSVDSCATNSQSPAVSSMEDFTDRDPQISNHLNRPNYTPIPPTSQPPPYTVPDKKKHRVMFRKTWSGPRPLSMFAIPKPGAEGKLRPLPSELPTCFPAGGSSPPLSPPMLPEARDAQISQTDVLGGSYGPSRVAGPGPSPQISDPPVFVRKERRSWLTNKRSPKDSLPTV